MVIYRNIYVWARNCVYVEISIYIEQTGAILNAVKRTVTYSVSMLGVLQNVWLGMLEFMNNNVFC